MPFSVHGATMFIYRSWLDCRTARFMAYRPEDDNHIIGYVSIARPHRLDSAPVWIGFQYARLVWSGEYEQGKNYRVRFSREWLRAANIIRESSRTARFSDFSNSHKK